MQIELFDTKIDLVDSIKIHFVGVHDENGHIKANRKIQALAVQDVS
jgi:hypothetical protein